MQMIEVANKSSHDTGGLMSQTFNNSYLDQTDYNENGKRCVTSQRHVETYHNSSQSQIDGFEQEQNNQFELVDM